MTEKRAPYTTWDTPPSNTITSIPGPGEPMPPESWASLQLEYGLSAAEERLAAIVEQLEALECRLSALTGKVADLEGTAARRGSRTVETEGQMIVINVHPSGPIRQGQVGWENEVGGGWAAPPTTA